MDSGVRMSPLFLAVIGLDDLDLLRGCFALTTPGSFSFRCNLSEGSTLVVTELVGA